MKRLGIFLILVFLATSSMAQPLSFTPLTEPLLMDWEEGVALHGGDCTSSDAVVNAALTTVFDNAAGGLEFGQSFTAPCTGIVETISFAVYNTGTGFPSDSATVNLLLFEGAGTAGTALTSEPYTVRVPSAVGSWEAQIVTLSASIGVVAGQIYTFFIDQVEGNIQLATSNSSVYPDGRMYFTEDGNPASASLTLDRWDLTFRVDLLPPVPTASEPAPTGTYAISSVYPNPLRERGRFSLLLEEGQHVRIAAFDVLGREVALLHDGSLSAERHAFDLRVNGWPSGVYFITIQGETVSATRKLIVAR